MRNVLVGRGCRLVAHSPVWGVDAFRPGVLSVVGLGHLHCRPRLPSHSFASPVCPAKDSVVNLWIKLQGFSLETRGN